MSKKLEDLLSTDFSEDEEELKGIDEIVADIEAAIFPSSSLKNWDG